MSTLIKKIEEFYVGFQAQHDNGLHLAFLTPFDNTAAFTKRKGTVDDWASHGAGQYINGKYVYLPMVPAINIKNEPLGGYKISESVRRNGSWNSGNVVWRIEDPRGFEWEISSTNLAQIITQTGISAGGIINGRCIIGRMGSANILIPEGTDLWNQMETDVALHSSRRKAPIITELSVGDHVTFNNGNEGVYLGKHRLRVSIPNDVELFKNASSSWNYVRQGGTFHDGDSIHEYHLVADVVVNFTSYVCIRAYKTNPAVIDVDVSKFSKTAATDYFKSPNCYFMFPGKAPEPTDNIIGLA